ncbi:MAG: MBL fold metallo-hydrolase, partial [Myxococcota bacterium]
HTPPARTLAPHGIQPVCVRATLNYLVPVEGGVVVVDAGFDPAGQVLREAIGDRKVLAVLLTHAHIDHRAAAHLFDAPVYVGMGDVPWFDDDRVLHAIGPGLGRRLYGVPPRPKDLRGVQDGDVLYLGGTRFVAHRVPGHTPGSVAWQFRDVLFTGDAVQRPVDDDHLYPAPWTVSEDVRQAWRSMRRLLHLDVNVLLDGHYGRTDDARWHLRQSLDAFDSDQPYEHPAQRPFGCAEGPLPSKHPSGIPP